MPAASLTTGPHGGPLLLVPGAVRTVNSMSKKSIYDAWVETSLWREVMGWEAKAKRMPRFVHPVVIHVYHHKARGTPADAGACFFAQKGAVDGLVDAKVLIDDSPKFVRAVIMHACERREVEALGLELVTVVDGTA